jgi:hypothetical protein
MPTDVFYAILKLTSGEEIISKVCAFEENDDILVVLDSPITVNLVGFQNTNKPLIKVTPWMSLIENEIHIINRKHIITMSELKDKSLINIHMQYIRDKNKQSNETTITSEMGYITSIEDARKNLEKLYQSKESNSNFE